MASKQEQRKYLVVIERAKDGSFSAYVPDLPGCVACGQRTRRETKRLIQDAINVHIRGMIEDDEPIPEPTARSEYVETSAA